MPLEVSMEKIEFRMGCSVYDAVLELGRYRRRGETVYGVFNTHILRSDTVTLDGAYLKIVGCSYVDSILKQEEYQARRDAEDIRAISPENIKHWEKEARGVLAPNKLETWDYLVPIRLRDLYHGMELGSCLEIIKVLNDDDFPKAFQVLSDQNHSGMSYGLVQSLVISMSDKGESFYEYIEGLKK